MFQNEAKTLNIPRYIVEVVMSAKTLVEYLDQARRRRRRRRYIVLIT